MVTLYRKEGQSQVVDEQGNLQGFSGNLDSLPIYNKGTVKSDQIKPGSGVNLGNQTQDTTNYAGITGGVADSIINEYNNLNTKLTSAQDTQDKSGQSIIDLMGTLTGKTADTQEANRLAGVDTETANLNKYAEQLAGLNAQATSLNREAQAIPLQVQEQFKNTGATNRGVAPIETGKLRENAIRALSIAQQSDIAAAAATGSQLRLQAAKDKAQQIVDLKYKPLEDALAIKKEQYLLNKDLLTSISAKRTEALNIALKREEQAIADKKETEKSIRSLALDVSKNQAPLSVIEKINNAKTYEEAINLASAYMVSPADKLDLQLKRLQIAKASKDLNETSGSGLLSIDDAQKLGLPYGTTKQQAIALQGKAPATELQLSTFNNAQKLMTKLTEKGGRNAPIGGRNISLKIPGSPFADYVTIEKTLKNQLTLENLKYLKGPTSDKDIVFITSASSALNRNTSPKQYKETLQAIVDTLSKYSPEYQYATTGYDLSASVANDPYANQLQLINQSK
jgi:hypothetical protein